MSGRRPKVSARPNLARGNRTVGNQQSKTTEAAKPTGDVPLDTGSADSSTPAEAVHTKCDGELSVTAAKCDGELSVTAAKCDGELSVTAAKCDGKLSVTAAAANDDQEGKRNAADADEIDRSIRRRSKIQAKPQLSRKPRPPSTTTAQSTLNPATEATSSTSIANTTVSEELVATESQGQSTDTMGPAVADATLSPVAPSMDNSMPSPAPIQDVSLPSPRHFKSRAKPNVAEAGRARMRKLSETLDLSPHFSRRRHTSTSGGDNTSESVVRVEPVGSPVPPSSQETVPAFPAAEKNAKRRRESKRSHDDEISREIEEQEQLEVMAAGGPPPLTRPKRTRKVRRLIKSDQAPDTAKMTIKDLIYFQPTSNPLPQKASSKSNEKEGCPQEAESDNRSVASPPPAEPELDMAPQLMIGEDGQVIINQQSLTVQQTPQQPVSYEDVTVDRDGEGATYASFRPNNSKNSKMWTGTETDQFYKALNAIGTDFSLMCQLFPKRSRAELKKKFKKEERTQLAKVQLAMHGKLKFDAEPFPERDFEKEKLEKQANKKDQRKSRGGSKVRTYYDVANPEEFREKQAYKRKGYTKDKNGTATNSSVDTPTVVGLPSKKLLKLNTQATLEEASSSDQYQVEHSFTPPNPLSSASQVGPSFPSRPIPSISTMLDQNPRINDKISDLILSNRAPVQPPLSSTRNSELVLSPLYNLDNGDTIMVSTKAISGTDKRMHHLYLFSPPKGGAAGSKASVLGSLDPINVGVSAQNISQPATIAPKRVTAAHSSVPNDTCGQVSTSSSLMPSVNSSSSGQLPCYQHSPNHEASTCIVSPTTLTRLVTPKAVRTMSAAELIHSKAADPNMDSELFVSHSIVTAKPAIPTRKLGWEVVFDEYGVATEEKQLTFTHL